MNFINEFHLSKNFQIFIAFNFVIKQSSAKARDFPGRVEIPVPAGFRAKFKIRAAFRVQN